MLVEKPTGIIPAYKERIEMNQPINHNISASQLKTLRMSNKIPEVPVKCLPKLLRGVVEYIGMYTGMPLELVVNVILTIISFVCQYLVCVVSPYTNKPGPCSLYLLTLAESGEGKSFILNLLMSPIYERLAKMNQRYQVDMIEYKRNLRVWKTVLQGLDANLRQAIKKDYGVDDAKMKLEEHYSEEPKKPVEPKFIYEDVSHKALIQRLSQQAEAGIITDEAISFFKSMLKNHLALLNKGWDGGTYSFQRADGESYELTLCLMISLMVQPEVFMDYLEKHGEIAKSSGFLARFLIVMVKSSIGSRRSDVDGANLKRQLQPFFSRLRELLDIFETRFYDDNSVKDILRLTRDAEILLQRKHAEIEAAIAPAGKWAHIRDFSSKSTGNALRLAAILEYFSFNKEMSSRTTNYISEAAMKSALELTEWYLNQASILFHSLSEQYQFEQDVRELFTWIKERLVKSCGVPFLKNDLAQYGPRHLRRARKLEPVLAQLIGQGCIAVLQTRPGAALYISPRLPNGSFAMAPDDSFFDDLSIPIQSYHNTKGRDITVDLSDL